MDQTPAAPAPTPDPAPVPTPTVSASVDAVTKNDYSAFHEAEAASRKGTPKPSVEVTAAPPAPTAGTTEPPAAPVTPQVQSKRQIEANERTRRAVEQATADLRAENDRLRAAQSRPAQPQTPAAPREPEWKRYAAMPEAPRLDAVDAQGNAVFQTVEEHAAAMALFIDDTRHAERTQAAQFEQHETQRQRFLMDRGEQFQTKLEAAAAADPDFLDKIPPAVATARPLSGLTREELKTATFANVAAEAAFRSDDPEGLLKYLHSHQDEAVAIASQPPSEWLTRLCHLDGRLSGSPVVPAAPAPVVAASPISAAPPPPPIHQRAGGSADPAKAALDKGDYASMSQIWRAERVAKRTA